MTLKLCIFGNSHVAALKSALRAHPGRWSKIEVQVVGAHNELLLDTELRDGALVPTTPEAATAFGKFGGGAGVDLDGFDALAIAGCQVSAARAAMIHRSCRWVGLPSVAELDDASTLDLPLVSAALARAALDHSLSGTLGLRLARHLRPMTDRPILLLSQPRTNARVLTMTTERAMAQRRAIRAGDAAYLSAMFEEAATRLLAETGVSFVPQPAETIAQSILTRQMYANGAPKLALKEGARQPPEDVLHANAGYGAVVLDQLEALLGDAADRNVA